MKKLIFKTFFLFFLTVLILFPISLVYAQIVEESTSWNGSYISTVGAWKSDFYGQSFRANHLTRITKFGVMIGESSPQGEVILAIAGANALGRPDLSAILYQGALINPGPALTWFYEEGISVPVTMGQKYFVLVDGYNNAGATGNSRVGSSNTYTATGESMFYTNDNGSTWGQTGAIAVYIEGTAPPIANAVSANVEYNSTNNNIALNITGGPPTSVAVASAPNHGTATASGLSISYTPDVGYSGVDSFTYTATNAEGTSAAALVTITIGADSDGDGIPDWEEYGPDGNNPGYDGNRDGIPDRKQVNVASFHTYDAQDNSHYITLAVPKGQYIEHVNAKRALDAPPAGVSFPYGFFSFMITGLVAAGDSTTATIYLDGEPPQSYFKYGKTPDNPQDHWYEFSFDGQTGAEVVGNKVILHFMDGQRGDHDLEANARIADPGGPAQIAPHAGLYFPYLVSTAEERMEIGIINTKGYASTSTIAYYGEGGDLIKTDPLTLGPYGKATVVSANIPLNAASAVVTGDGDPVGYTRYVNSQGKRCAWSAATSLQKSFSVPHTAVDANWATAISLFNPNDEAAEVTLTTESGADHTFTLNGKSRKFYRLTEEEPVVSIVSTGSISAMELFDSLALGGDAAALLLKDRSMNALYVPSILYGAGEFTGIGLQNRYNGMVHITGYSASGATQEVSFGTQPLGTQTPQSRTAFNLSGMLGEANEWAVITGEADFSTPFGNPLLQFQGVAIYGIENAQKLGAVNLNHLGFRKGFMVIPSDASETASLTLANPGAIEATITVTGYNGLGEVLANNTTKIPAGSSWSKILLDPTGDIFSEASPAGMTHAKIISDKNLYGFEMITNDDRIEMLPIMGRE